MKRLLIIGVALSFAPLYAKNINMLYGFKLGQSSAFPAKQLGKPFKTHKFPDGFSYQAYKKKDHVAVFESDASRPDLIWAIQIEGLSNPPDLGLGEINLGDPISKVVARFGEPDTKKEAIDEATKKTMPGIEYYSYNQSSNFSIESTKGIVSSIKILFNGVNENKNPAADTQDFLDAVRTKNYYRIGEYIFLEFEYLNGDKSVKLSTSPIDALKNNREIRDIFFNPEYGLISVTDKDIKNQAMRYQVDPTMIGSVVQIERGKRSYELLFIQSFEGWVLKHIVMRGK